MIPLLIELDVGGAIPGIPSYGTALMVAFALAIWVVHVRARTVGIDPDRLLGIYLVAALGGILGSRLLYAIAVTPEALLTDPTLLFKPAGFAYYGGVLGGSALVFALAGVLKVNGWKLADLIAPSLVLGLGLGRIGCLGAGCCHGAAVPHFDGTKLLTLPGGSFVVDSHFPFLATEFYNIPFNVTRIRDVALYPTQLWSVLAAITLFAILSAVWRNRRFDGQVAALMLLTEPPLRILIESFRADDRGYVVTTTVSESVAAWLPPGFSQAGDKLPGQAVDTVIVGLTTSQGIGLAMMAVGVFIFLRNRKRGVAPETPIEVEEEL